jgi:GTPase SAR1 family protein
MSTAHRGDADSEEDDDLERKSLTYYSQVFSGVQIGEKPIRILVEGGAGTGKTALCMLLFKGWENGEIFQNIELLLLLPLNQAKIAEARSIPQLIKTLFPSCNSDIISYIEQTKGENVLIIADGFSDLAETEFQRGSFLHNLLLGGLLNQASVLITSRPSASASLHKTSCNIDYFMEIYGFSGSTIRHYIREQFTGDQQKAICLLEQLEGNSLIQEVCRIPLNCAVVCFLWQNNEKLLFSTTTGFLTEIILNFVYRNMLKNDAYISHPRLLNIRSLPETLHNPWGVVCEVAFQTIQFSPGIHPQIELAAIALSQPGLEILGVLEVINKISFRFIHPTFQKFFAALYLTMQPLNKQLEVFKLHAKSKHLTLFYRLFFGLYFQKNIDVAGISQIMYMLSQSYAANNDEYLLCHYAFEAKNSVVTEGVIGALSNRTKTMSFGHPSTALDCRAVVYIIANIQKVTLVEIDFHDCHLGDKWMCDEVVSVLCKKPTIVYVKILNLVNNNLTDNGIVELFSEEAASAFRYLAKLYLRDNWIGERSVCAIKATLAKSSCSMSLLDLSNNPLSTGGIKELQSAMESSYLKKLEILFLRGTLPTDNTSSNVSCLNAFAVAVSTHCPRLRRLDLSAIDLGEPGDKAICNLVLHFTGTKTNFDLQLNREYIPEVDKKFMAVMEDCIKKKGTIDHTVVHGIIVGPGRSGKDSLMNRLLGNAPQNKIYLSASTGVLESVVKVEVKKLCCTTVAAAANNLIWRRLDYNEEALEFMMSTAKHCSVAHDRKTRNLSQSKMVDSCKFSQTGESCDNPPQAECNEGKLVCSNSLRVKPKAHYVDEYLCEDEFHETSMLHSQANQVLVVPVQDKWPGVTDVLKSAVESRRMDDLREHLESSWSLYLTNTGGQMEFQELLPLLVCGPSAFFVTFPLNKDLMEHYTVLYHHNDADRTEETYQSPSTLMDEILQTLATINALDLTGHQQDYQPMPKVFLIGTHKDKLPDHLVEKRIQEIDQQLQEKIRQTSLFRQGSIEFAELQGKKRLIFTVNNLAKDDTDFQKIRCALQQAIDRTDQFTIKCPSTWLIFSLALRAKHKSSQILTYDECFTFAQGCGISDREELSKALFFIHTRLGLVRYFNVKELNKRVIIDPQILFDKITDLIVKTFVFDNADVNEVEKFQNQGIFSVKTMERICRKRHRSESQLPFKWLLELLSHLRIAAVFKDKDGTFKCFFPAVLCYAPAQQRTPLEDSDSAQHNSLLVAFEGGFCPRGIPSALITYLISNEMDSEFVWDLFPYRVFKNQVCFSIEGCSDIIIKIHSTHLQLYVDPEAEINDENELKLTVGEVYKCIEQGMKTIAKGYKNCYYYFAFHCTMHDCKKYAHPARVIWRDDRPVKLKCMVTYKQYSLPDHGVWDLRRVNYTEVQGILSVLCIIYVH